MAKAKGRSNNVELRTEGGYPLDECISALQKCIRRGLIEDAMFWAVEVETRYPDYLWRRLLVIANEDIGLANPEVLVLIPALATTYTLLRKASKSTSERLCLANAILALCRSEKSRAADDLQTVIYQRRAQKRWKLNVPDFALDKHTRRGRTMRRGWEHFHEEGTRLDTGDGANRWRQEAEALRQTKVKVERGEEQESEQDELPF